jgi:hypothetical protein
MATRSAASFHKLYTYTVTRDDKPMYFGTDGDIDVRFNSTRDGLLINTFGKFVDAQSFNLGDRVRLVERFERKPGVNADIQNSAEATRMVANTDFEVLGTNASSGSVALHASGGITITTAGASADSVIILPHLDSNQTAWSTVTWGTDRETEWECSIRLPTTITGAIFYAGLKLTNTDTVATDADQVFFRFEQGTDTYWVYNYSIGGTDTSTATTVTPTADTTYRFKIVIDSSRLAKMYINGALVATSTALTTGIDLIPYIGIKDKSAGAARSLHIHHQAISRNYD